MENGKPVILIIDNPSANLDMTQALMENNYKVKMTDNGKTALAMATASPPDLILLALNLPDMNSYDLCHHLKSEPAFMNIPLIFLTTRGEFDLDLRGLKIGAADYMLKPLDTRLILARINTLITLKQTQDFLKDKNNYLETEISHRIKEMSAFQEITIVAMASLAETRDSETSAHIQRTSEYMRELALQLRNHKRFQHNLTPENIRLLVKSAPLHDIGKVGVPDTILLKPSALNSSEFEVMKTHTSIGKNAINKAELLVGNSENFLHIAKDIAYFHHEKWNGSGYPEGLSGESIPISARLMSVADVYDALVSRRIYKEPVSHEQAVKIITEESGKHFDPDIVTAFLYRSHRFQEIAEIIRDELQ